MKADKPAPVALDDDLRTAGDLLEGVCGKRSIPLVLLLLGAIWLAVERLRHAVQASARADDWRSSDAGTLAKGRALGIEPRPGEKMSDYRTRLASAMRERGLA